MALLTRRTLVAYSLAGGAMAAGTATLVGTLAARKPAQAEEVTMLPLSTIERITPPGDLPDTPVTAMDGTTKHLMSDWKGQVVVLNFWATWCIPCVAELPALDHLAADNPGITVLALSADRAGADAVRPFLAAHNITHATILLDPHMEAGRAFNVAGFPTTLIIDPSGHLRGRLEGPANWAAAADTIKSLVA